MIIERIKRLKGEITVPGDKSISHRAVMLGSLSSGTTEITNFLNGADCLSTIACFQKMGISVTRSSRPVPGGSLHMEETISVHGNGLHGLKKPGCILDAGNSGTTTRLMSGILAAQDFETTITGDASIQTRPMGRVITPLARMGADITSLRGSGCAPLRIQGRPLHAIHYSSPVASAQVKSAILFAGLYADGETAVTEPYISRNHTELMLSYFGVPVTATENTAAVQGGRTLTAQRVIVPGDISSAAYFIAAGLITPNSEILIRNVGVNPTRDGILKVCKEMGGSIQLLNERTESGERTADILIKHSPLHGTDIGGRLIPALIDELPVIAVLACFADGQTIIRDAGELKVKECNRIDAMTANLKTMGADVVPTEDGMIINGGKALHGAVIDCHKDHRIAMSLSVAGLAADGSTDIRDTECISISYPGFYDDLYRLCN